LLRAFERRAPGRRKTRESTRAMFVSTVPSGASKAMLATAAAV
jgi:hypothetical protein